IQLRHIVTEGVTTGWIITVNTAHLCSHPLSTFLISIVEERVAVGVSQTNTEVTIFPVHLSVAGVFGNIFPRKAVRVFTVGVGVVSVQPQTGPCAGQEVKGLLITQFEALDLTFLSVVRQGGLNPMTTCRNGCITLRPIFRVVVIGGVFEAVFTILQTDRMIGCIRLVLSGQCIGYIVAASGGFQE